MHNRLSVFCCKTKKRNQNISMYYFVIQNAKDSRKANCAKNSELGDYRKK